MKIEFEKKNSKDTLSGLVQGTVNLGKKVAANAKSGVTTIVEKSKTDRYTRRMKKYNPLFPDHYQSDSFKLPNIIMIVDDAVRRDIDVCEGAIGWLNSETGAEVLCLYDEAVEFSGIQFIPAVTCDAVYYVDSFNRNRFIRADCIFKKAHEERMAELKYIAYCLGAKKCSIEICECALTSLSNKKTTTLLQKVKGNNINESAELSASQATTNRRKGKIEAEFEGSAAPQVPELKWFAHDDTIKRLIEMRCNMQHTIKVETLELAGSSSATMTKSTAYNIDCAIGKGSVSMQDQATKEHNSSLLFHIEF